MSNCYKRYSLTSADSTSATSPVVVTHCRLCMYPCHVMNGDSDSARLVAWAILDA